MVLRRRGTAIVDTPNGILVVSEDGRTYHLPGGVAKKGESRRKAAIRELREETGLIAIDCSYIFEYTSHSNNHKVFLIKCTGTAEPKNEIKYIAYFDASNVNVSDTTKKIIERYNEGNFKVSELEECRECVTRKKDHSEKELHKCFYCGVFFCTEHFEPKPAFIRDFARYSKYPEIVALIEKETNVEGKHPCFQFTYHWFEEQDQKLKLERKLLMEWLDKSKVYKYRFPRIPTIKPVREYPKIQKYRYSRKPKSSRKKILKVSIPVLIGLLLLIAWYVFFPMINSTPPVIPMIDNTPPTISIVSPEEGAVLRDTITVEAYVNDPSGIEEVELRVGGSFDGFMDFNNVTGHWIRRLYTILLPDGTVYIKVKAVDKAGNVAEKTVVATVDNTPPVITIISPRMYRTNIIVYGTAPTPIDLIYTVNEPTSWVGYSLNNKENITLAGNITLTNLSLGRYELTIYANDTAGNMDFSRASFTVTKVFNSLDELRSFLREDDLSDVEWTSDYTCVKFTEDFIQRAEMQGYYCFTYYSLFGEELDKFVDVVRAIGYIIFTIPDVGHAVVRTTVGGMDVLVDPQTDIILAMEDFTVLYEGEITHD